MIAYLLYNRDTPAQRRMEELAEKLKAEQVETEMLDADSPRGIQFAENYELMARPAVVVVRTDGSPVEVWQGDESIPLVSDIVFAAHQ